MDFYIQISLKTLKAGVKDNHPTTISPPKNACCIVHVLFRFQYIYFNAVIQNNNTIFRPNVRLSQN